VVNALWST